MYSATATFHVDGTEAITSYAGEATNHAAFFIGDGQGHEVRVALPHRNGAEVNADFLERVAAELNSLAFRLRDRAEASA